MKIAVIEDDEITRLELSKLLEAHGYETVLLTDFENIINELVRRPADLILLDVNLPYENGYDACKKKSHSSGTGYFRHKQGYNRRRIEKHSGRRDRFYYETI